jgi:hypothetical protein
MCQLHLAADCRVDASRRSDCSAHREAGDGDLRHSQTSRPTDRSRCIAGGYAIDQPAGSTWTSRPPELTLAPARIVRQNHRRWRDRRAGFAMPQGTRRLHRPPPQSVAKGQKRGSVEALAGVRVLLLTSENAAVVRVLAGAAVRIDLGALAQPEQGGSACPVKQRLVCSRLSSEACISETLIWARSTLASRANSSSDASGQTGALPANPSVSPVRMPTLILIVLSSSERGVRTPTQLHMQRPGSRPIKPTSTAVSLALPKEKSSNCVASAALLRRRRSAAPRERGRRARPPVVVHSESTGCRCRFFCSPCSAVRGSVVCSSPRIAP